MSKISIITGITGQDGYLLARNLLNHDRTVIGIVRRTSRPLPDRLGWLQREGTQRMVRAFDGSLRGSILTSSATSPHSHTSGSLGRSQLQPRG